MFCLGGGVEEDNNMMLELIKYLVVPQPARTRSHCLAQEAKRMFIPRSVFRFAALQRDEVCAIADRRQKTIDSYVKTWEPWNWIDLPKPSGKAWHLPSAKNNTRPIKTSSYLPQPTTYHPLKKTSSRKRKDRASCWPTSGSTQVSMWPAACSDERFQKDLKSQ